MLYNFFLENKRNVVKEESYKPTVSHKGVNTYVEDIVDKTYQKKKIYNLKFFFSKASIS